MGYVGKVTDTSGTTHLVGSTLYGTCTTAASTSTKVVSCANFSELVTGVTIHVRFTYSNTAASPTLDVNSTGAKNLCCYGTTRVGTTAATSWSDGAVVSFTYDGTRWMMNDYIANTDYDTYPSGLRWNISSSSDRTAYLSWVDNSNASRSFSPPATLVAQSPLMASVSNYALTLGVSTDSSITAGSTSTNLPTTAAVVTYVASQMSGATAFQGTVNSSTDISGLTAYTAGWYWVVATAGTYAGQVCEVGDMIICVSDYSSAYSADDFDVVQNNIETLTTTEIDTLWAAA